MYVVLLLCAYLNVFADVPVLIITHQYNCPEFISLQKACFDKFLKEPYRFVVFDNSEEANVGMTQKIEEECRRCGVEYVRIPQAIHRRPYLKRWAHESWEAPSVRCSNALQYSLDVMGFDHPGIVLVIDSDMFLVKPFSVTEFLEGYDLAGIWQRRGHVDYILNWIVLMDMRRMPNKRTIDFNCGMVDGICVDVGGQTSNYFRSNPRLCFKAIGEIYFGENGASRNIESLRQQCLSKEQIVLIQSGIDNIQFFCPENQFFHYRSGTNWDAKSRRYHENKRRICAQYFSEILGEL